MYSPTIQPTTWWPSTTLPPPLSTAFPPSRSEFDLPFGRPRTSWDLPEPPQQPAFGVQQPPSSTGWHLQGAVEDYQCPMDTLISVLQRMEAKLDTVIPKPEAPFHSRPEQEPSYGSQSAWQQPLWTPGSIATPAVTMSVPFMPPASSTALTWPPVENHDNNLGHHHGVFSRPFDPPPLTAWDRPRQRLGELGHQHSVWDPPPPRGGAFQPTPPSSLPEWRLPTWDLGSRQATTPAAPILAPSLPLVQHQLQPLPAPCVTPPPPSRDGFYVPVPQPCVSDPPPSLTDYVPCPLAEEAADSNMLGDVENQNSNFVKATIGSGNGGGDANNAVQSTVAFIKDDECEKILAFTADLMVYGSKAAKEGDDFVVAFAKEEDELERASSHSRFGWAFLHQAQEGAVPFSLKPNTRSEGGRGGKGMKSQEVSRSSVICGIYALEEVYKDLLNLHLEDKVILKGGGVDTDII